MTADRSWESPAQARNRSLAGTRRFSVTEGGWRLDAEVRVPELVGGSLHRPRITHSPDSSVFRLAYGRHRSSITYMELMEAGPFPSDAHVTQWLYAKLYIFANMHAGFDRLAEQYIRDPRILSEYVRAGRVS